MATRKPAKKSTPKTQYENNPFFIAANGILLLVNTARGIAIFLFILSLLNFLGGPRRETNDEPKEMWDNFVNTITNWSMNEWFIAIGTGVIIGLAIALVSALVGGVSSYTSYKISRGESAKLNDAIRVAFDNLWGFLWLQIIVFVKTLLWTLLFIIPGIYMAFRYSLANTAFFDERKHLRGNAAVKESLRLTKGAWITTFASNVLFNLISFSVLSLIVSTSVNAVLYRQFNELGDKPKPEAHWLSWIMLTLPLVLFVFAMIFIIALIVGFAAGGSLAS